MDGDGWTVVFQAGHLHSFCRREWSSSICYGRKLHDPAGAVRLTGSSAGQPAVHPLSRLDRPAVTQSAVKTWAEGFEMWQHNQFPWFMITSKGGHAERLGSWKRRAEGECWQQQSTAMYSGGDFASGCYSLLDLTEYNTIMRDCIDPGGKILFSLHVLQRKVRTQGRLQYRGAPWS